MIFGWFKPKCTPQPKPETPWEFSERPYYNKEHRETMEIVNDIIAKLDEIKIIIGEMKEKENEVK
jgi:hypothetical protein